MRGAVLLDPSGGPSSFDPEATLARAEADGKLVQVFKNLRRAQELAGPWEPRASTNAWQELIRTEVQDATAVGNSTSEAVLVPNYTLPARYLVEGRTFRATVRGRYTTTATPTITVRLRIGGVAGAIQVASAAFTLGTVGTAAPFKVSLEATVRSFGTSTTGTTFAMGEMIFATAAPNTAVPQFLPSASPAAGAGYDSTAAQDFSITAQWSAQNASNTMTAHMYLLESMN